MVNVKVITVGNKNTKYVAYTKQIDLGQIKKDLHIPDSIKEDVVDVENWTTELCEDINGEYFVNIISTYEDDKIYVALNDFENDAPEYIYYSKDGWVFASSDLPTPDLSSENFYAGDECFEIGKTGQFSTTEEWLWGGVRKVRHCEQLSLKGETLKYLVGKDS